MSNGDDGITLDGEFVVGESPNYLLTVAEDRKGYAIINKSTGVTEMVEPILSRAWMYMKEMDAKLVEIADAEGFFDPDEFFESEEAYEEEGDNDGDITH